MKKLLYFCEKNKSHMMKKMFLALMGVLVLTGCGMVREIECDTVNEEGAHVRITSANRLFSGCGVRICEYTPKGEKQAQYALELDIQDRVIRARKGNLLTVHLYDGSKVVLKNLYDAESEVTETVENQLESNTYTDFVPVYDGWYDAVYSVPVTRRYSYTRPVVRRESWVKLYYIITPAQMQQIIDGQVESVVVATDREPIEKTGRDLPEILRGLMALFRE